MSAVPVGQLLCIGLPEAGISDESRALLREVEPGGILLFRRNIESAPQLFELSQGVRTLLTPPPIFCIDQEGGSVDRLGHLFEPLPPNRAISSLGPAGARAHGYFTGRLLNTLGFSLNLAPVVDLDYGYDNGIGARSYGKDPRAVILLADSYFDGLEIGKMSGVLKHFPGLGRTRYDSHDTLPSVDDTKAELWKSDLFPFRSLLPRAFGTMVGHALYPHLDPQNQPASLSRTIITDFLQEELGFQGMVLSDDLEMGALSRWPLTERTQKAFDAGNDMLLICSGKPDPILTVFRTLRDEAKRRLPAYRDRTRRTLRLKDRLGPSPKQARYPQSEIEMTVSELKEWVEQIETA